MAVKSKSESKARRRPHVASSLVMSFPIFNFEMYQVLFTQAGLPDVWLGPAYATFGVLMALGAKTAAALERVSPSTVFVACILLTGVSFALVCARAGSILLLGVVVILQQVTFGALGLVLETYLLGLGAAIDAKSAVLSMQSTVANLIKAGVVAALAIALREFGLRGTYLIMAVVMGVAALVMLTRTVRPPVDGTSHDGDLAT